MYVFQLSFFRQLLDLNFKFGHWDGGTQDSGTAFAIAADQDALAHRLLDCADIHFALATRALTPTGALRESARALQLMELAGEAKLFSERMLSAAIIFERANDQPEGSDAWKLAAETWGQLMQEGIFDLDMYGDMNELDDYPMDEVMSPVRDEVSDGIAERREFARNRDYN